MSYFGWDTVVKSIMERKEVMTRFRRARGEAPPPGSFRASPAWREMQPRLPEIVANSPNTAHFILGVDWMTMGKNGTWSVGVIMVKLLDVPPEVCGKWVNSSVLAVIDGGQHQPHLTGFLDLICRDIRKHVLGPGDLGVLVEPHPGPGVDGVAPARVEPVRIHGVPDYVYIWDVRMKFTHEDIMQRGAPFEHGWSTREPREAGCHGQPLLPLLLPWLDARFAYLVAVEHCLLYGLLKHLLEWWMSAEGLDSKVRQEMEKRCKAIQSPSDFGRDLGDIVNRQLKVQEENVGRTCLFGELWIERVLHDLKSITTSGIPGPQLDAHIAKRAAMQNASSKLHDRTDPDGQQDYNARLRDPTPGVHELND
ncbi:hypothetical protein V8C86DRAFT_3187647 [Haematococcus lacustris]